MGASKDLRDQHDETGIKHVTAGDREDQRMQLVQRLRGQYRRRFSAWASVQL